MPRTEQELKDLYLRYVDHFSGLTAQVITSLDRSAARNPDQAFLLEWFKENFPAPMSMADFKARTPDQHERLERAMLSAPHSGVPTMVELLRERDDGGPQIG